jgi:S-formylglutathione hydrolase FrmB
MKNIRLHQFLLVAFLLLANVGSLFAARVDTIETTSAIMKKKIKAVIVLPDAYAEGKALPVVYLLHGYSGNYSNWINEVPALKGLADEYQLIIVCADGNASSWYFDVPGNMNWQYEPM